MHGRVRRLGRVQTLALQSCSALWSARSRRKTTNLSSYRVRSVVQKKKRKLGPDTSTNSISLLSTGFPLSFFFRTKLPRRKLVSKFDVARKPELCTLSALIYVPEVCIALLWNIFRRYSAVSGGSMWTMIFGRLIFKLSLRWIRGICEWFLSMIILVASRKRLLTSDIPDISRTENNESSTNCERIDDRG